eukprot:TRINITY_DN482_c1_g3_i2.p1 TRINITY_DN482_c1_g3~~TRINITY_DN482_c1_g3_i2.p1  ORF type:complete len:607 (-),score=197.52 TRINITY_DN482_c1_g3_i2:352-2172(-)
MAAVAAAAPRFASLYVGDLSADVTEAMLYEIFNSVGPVASIRVCRDSVTRRSLGYAYVNYHGVADAERALDTLNYSSIKGRSCRIMWSQRDPSARKGGASNIFVKNLDPTIDNKALYDTFSLFGNILSCKVASDREGKSYGYGFVHYETEEAAKQAIEKVNGMMIGGRTVQVTEHVKANERDATGEDNYTNLYLKNFPKEYTEEKVTEMCKEFGAITSVGYRTDGKGRPFAFVSFETHEEAKKCVEALHKKDMRSDEEKAKAEGKEPTDDDLVYCQRLQSKKERQQEMRSKFDGDGKGGAAEARMNLFVKNLGDDTDDEALRKLFEPFGTITSCAVPKDEKGKCKGFGFVCFETPDEATKAVTEMHLKVIEGKPLYVGLAEKREARMERLAQRYTVPGVGKGGGGKGGKGGDGKGMSGKGKGMPGGKGMPFPGQPPMFAMMPPQGPQPGMPMGMPPQYAAMMQQQAMQQKAMQQKAMMGGKGMPMMPMMGMMRPPMPGGMPMMMQRPPMPMPTPAQPAPQAGAPSPNAPLSSQNLNSMPPQVARQMIGEKLYPMVAKFNGELAGKVTGMMLEMSINELLMLLDSEAQLKHKVDEAMRVLGGGGASA